MNSNKDEVMDEEVPPQKLDDQIKRKSLRFHLNVPLRKWSLIPESNLIFIIRSAKKYLEADVVCPTSRKLLKSLRLLKLHTGVFVKADKSIMGILRKLKPYVSYRYPSRQAVKILIDKRVAIKFDNKITRLGDNPSLVEQAFGKYNISCIADIVNEIANVGPHFDEVSKALLPFVLEGPKPRMPRNVKKKCNSDGGNAGNREDHHINELLDKMKITS